jgi:hypothetical protein
MNRLVDESSPPASSRVAAGAPGHGGAAGPRAATKFASGRYYAALVILGLSAISLQSLGRWFEAHFEKEPLPLKRPLHTLSLAKVAPQYTIHPTQEPPLTHELVESLGTEEYLNWRLSDTTVDPRDPTRIARVFITYYTGQPDMVPHDPRECQQAGGWDLVAEDVFHVSIEGPNGKDVRIPVAALDFVPPGGGGGRTLTVLFFFYANGEYVTTRGEVRFATSNLGDRYAYYSKIELSFINDSVTRSAPHEASKEAGARLLKKIMPVLWADHFPDWDAIKSKATSE